MKDFSQTLAAARAGDELAFAGLFEFALPAVTRVLQEDLPQDLRGVEYDLDLLQTTYMEAWVALARLEDRGPAAFVAWMVTLTRRNLLNAIHWERRLKRGGGRRPLPLIDPADAPCDSLSVTPSVAAGWAEAKSLLDAVLASLRSSQRELLHLHHGRGLSPRQIGALLGKSPGAVAMALRRLEMQVRRRVGWKAKTLHR